jgi:hypothetical protein
MNDDEWELPAPREDPETRGFRLPGADEGGAKLVPNDNIVEGDMEEDVRKGPSGCPFSSP